MFGVALFAKMIALFFAAPPQCDNLFFGFPHWWQYLENAQFSASCEITDFKVPDDFLAVGLAVTGMLLYLAGIAAVISIIISGVGYITAGGNAEKAASARRRTINSLIGLGIVVIASVLVTFVGNNLGDT